MEHQFGCENYIKKVGGKLAEDYKSFCRCIEQINDYYFDLFTALGITDLDTIIDVLLDSLKSLQKAYKERVFRDIESGAIPIEKYMNKNKRELWESLTPERKTAQRQIYLNYISHVLSLKFNKIFKEYIKDYDLFGAYLKPSYPILAYCREALVWTPDCIRINSYIFLDIYEDFIKADESESKRLQQEAADALNKFFNGAFPITQEDLADYFILEDGIVKINPLSVSTKSYSRLGVRRTRRRKK